MSMPDMTIVVPTYWGRPGGQPSQRGDAVYDHPTPLDGESTLPRLLASLATQDSDGFNVLILTAAVHPALAEAAGSTVGEIIAPFRDAYPIAQCRTADLQILHERTAASGFDPALLSLRGYANIRNLQLVVPHILGASLIIALDDDETVAPGYVQQAGVYAGSRLQGRFIGGVAGIYLDERGGWLLPERAPSGNIFLDKAAIMNAAARELMGQGEILVRSPTAYGGNTVFHRDLFTHVPFDPGITRGEDIDYLLNARLQGRDLWFDRQLVITHLPPARYRSSPYAALCEDVIRFVYEREKLAQAGLDPAAFDPYPGRFLREDLGVQALAALAEMGTLDEMARWGSPQAILARARAHAEEQVPRFFDFAETWPKLMNCLGSDSLLRAHWQEKMKGTRT